MGGESCTFHSVCVHASVDTFAKDTTQIKTFAKYLKPVFHLLQKIKTASPGAKIKNNLLFVANLLRKVNLRFWSFPFATDAKM